MVASMAVRVSKKKVMEQPVPKKHYRPLGDVLAVKIFRFQDITDAGIILPDTMTPDNWATPIGVVVATGDEVKTVKEGDRVLVPQNMPCIKVRYDQEDLVLVHEKEIAGVLLPDE